LTLLGLRTLLPSGQKRGAVSRIRMVAGVAVLGVVLWVLYQVQHKRIGTFTIGSESMLPTLQVGEVWLMGPLPKRLKIGDIVVFKKPGADETMLVKRVVALESDRVELKNGQLIVNGNPSPPPQGKSLPLVGVKNKEWKVGKGECFVAGDNRAESEDSRDYGPIPISSMVGVLVNRV
jgi:signal peptidase I